MSQLMNEWKNLTISNQFIFSKVMRNREICEEVLRRILPYVDIQKIDIVEYEKVMDVSLQSKAVRLDLYLNDGKTVYNVEMQAVNKDDLPKRSRFYQAHIDMDCLAKGEFYHLLKNSFVIFICKFDLFQKGLPVYTFTNRCEEDSAVQLNDGATKIFLNTTNHEMVANQKMAEFLRFVNSENNAEFQTEDELVKKLKQSVEDIKQNKDCEVEYMNFSATLSQERYEGMQEGKLEMAMGMIQNNEPIEKIMLYSKMSQSQIEGLRNELFRSSIK